MDVLRVVIFPNSPKELANEKRKGRGSARALELEMLSPRNALLSDEGEVFGELLGQEISLLRVFLERIQTEEDLAMYGSHLRRFKKPVNGGNLRRAEFAIKEFLERAGVS